MKSFKPFLPFVLLLVLTSVIFFSWITVSMGQEEKGLGVPRRYETGYSNMMTLNNDMIFIVFDDKAKTDLVAMMIYAQLFVEQFKLKFPQTLERFGEPQFTEIAIASGEFYVQRLAELED